MRTPPLRHLEDEELLRYIDGELSSRASGQVRSHLETCWQCRVQLQELQDTVSESVRYRKNVLQCHLPPPPAPWIDIHRQFAQMDASMEPAFFSRLGRLLSWPTRSATRWAPVAAGLIILGFLLFQNRLTPSVHAAELLRKAVAASEAHPVKAHAIQIRTREHRFTRQPGARAISNPADSEALGAVQAMFVAANYDWNNPLSARAYQAWRDRLPAKTDEVVERPDAYSIRTSTTSGELTQATLTLDSRDLRPVQERLEFRNRDWVEITEIAEDTTLPVTQASAAVSGESLASGLPAGSVPSTIPMPEAAATVADELHAWAALHGIGADLGDPIEISLAGGKVLVSGAGVSTDRQQEIQSVLGSQPTVAVRFSEPVAAKTSGTRTPAATAAPGADILQLQARIADQAGGRASFEQLSSQVVDLCEPMMSRAYALRRLAEQFTPEAETQLGGPDRQILKRLRGEHAAALRQQVAGIERTLTPVLASLAGAARTPSAAPSIGGWQSASEELFQSARQVDKLVAVMFGSAPGDSTADQLPAKLLSNLARLHARLESYDRDDQ